MKIAVIGGSGMVGSRIVAEAAARGHDVIAISRKGDAAAAAHVTPVAANAGDSAAISTAVAGADAVVSAIGPSRDPGGDPATFPTELLTLAAAVKPIRLIVVGGAASLYAAPGVRLLDTPEFPDVYKVEATAAAASLESLRAATDLGEWTYLSPAPEIAPGERTGTYLVADDTPAGSFVSAEDFAVALVDEIERPAHTGRRFTVATR
jgi:putative NADH-flavin reductase